MHATDLETLISLGDYERAAAKMLDDETHGYVAGGASAEITLRDNEAAWERLAIRPRMLVGVGQRDLSVELLGRRRPHPVLVAPTAFQRLVHHQGEIATARAAAATGTIMCLSSLATTAPESLAQAVPEVDRWFQLYVFSDRGVSSELIARAVEHGYEALVVTVDLPVVGVRERELHCARSAPVQDVAGGAAAGTAGDLTPMQFGQLVDPDLDWADIERLVADSPLPVLLKGILTAEDARLAVEHGVAGVIVSNHGGRQLDTVLSGADALPEVVAAIGGRIDVLVDGGIRHGTDVLKALALGADATLIGRPVISGLAVAGAEGAQRVLEILRDEFDTALALAGSPRATDLDHSFIAPAPWTATAPGTGLRR